MKIYLILQEHGNILHILPILCSFPVWSQSVFCTLIKSGCKLIVICTYTRVYITYFELSDLSPFPLRVSRFYGANVEFIHQQIKLRFVCVHNTLLFWYCFYSIISYV